MEKKNVVVVGGGAAGFFCAIQIAELHPDWKITIVEKTSKLLSKVRVSACPEVDQLIKKYPRGQRFLKKSFYQFATAQTIEWFAKNEVKLHTEKDGRMFPITNDSETIVACFMKKVNQYQIEILLNHEVVSVIKKEHAEKPSFELVCGNQKTIQADQICFAVGGIVKAANFKWIEDLGHHFIPSVPSLFTFNVVDKKITTLMGLSLEHASIHWQGEKFIEQGPLLITHWGISGPAAIKLSAWCARAMADANYQGNIVINWVPVYNENSLRLEWMNLRQDFGRREMGSKNPFDLPQRLWHFLLQEAGVATQTKWADLKNTQQQQLIQLLTRMTLAIQGKTTFKEEFVTCGGVDLAEIDANTMESKLIPGLHFAGEMMDVDGITGGFNFQHAWTSGWIAAQHMGQ
jgi:predicted Rossmann fold flavoprotein